MKETLSRETERIDDIPLLISPMQCMKFDELLDKHVPTHGLRKGLSVGHTNIVWLAYVHAPADHCMNRVQTWATRRLDTLRGCAMSQLQALDLTDDRLADVLRLFSLDVHWQACEQDLMAQLVCVDTTTVSSYAQLTEQGLLQLGQSKDHRPDLAQRKVVLGSLDPLGMPVVTEVISRQQANDPMYVPIMTRVREGLQQSGLLYVGDGKMAALWIFAHIQAQGDDSLYPLSALHVPTAQLQHEVHGQRTQATPLVLVERLDEERARTSIAQGYETVQTVTAVGDGKSVSWQGRRFLVQSMAVTQSAQASLREPLHKAQLDLRDLTVQRQGKARLRERAAVQEAIKELPRQFHVEGLVSVQIHEQVQECSVRGYGGRVSQLRRNVTLTLEIQREEQAIVQVMSQLGWGEYASNQPGDHLSLPQAVEAYRDEYRVERIFSCLKGRPLGLAPLSVQRDDHRMGLVRWLPLALHAITLLEGVVRQRLAQQQGELAGLIAGNPTRRTNQPTTERLLEAFGEVTLIIVRASGFRLHPTPCHASFCSSAADLGPPRLLCRCLFATCR